MGLPGPAARPPSAGRDPNETDGRWTVDARRAFRAAIGGGGLWPLALAGFLLRGGIVLFLLPIVPLPSLVGLATLVGPASLTPGSLSPAAVGQIAGIASIALVCYLVGGFGAAFLEAAAIRASVAIAAPSLAAAGGGALSAPRDGAVREARRILVGRTIALLPLVVAAAWGIARVGSAAYTELVTPSDPTAALVMRVAERVPDAILALLAAWIIGEALGAVAARRVVLFGDGAAAAVARACRALARRPGRALATIGLGLVAWCILTLPALPALGAIWGAFRDAAGGSNDPFVGGGRAVALAFLLAFAWIVGLLLAAAAAAWRGLAWTVEVARAGP